MLRPSFAATTKMTRNVLLLCLTMFFFGCVKKNVRTNSDEKGRTRTQFHVVATIPNVSFEVSDSWLRTEFKSWMDQKKPFPYPYAEPSFALSLGWTLAKSLRFAFSQLHDLGATSAPDISSYLTKCVPTKTSNADIIQLDCSTGFDVFWKFQQALPPTFDVWIPKVRSGVAEQKIYADFKKTCSDEDSFDLDEFYLYFNPNKAGCKAKQSPLFQKVTLNLAIGEKTNESAAPDYSGVWADKTFVGTFAFAHELEHELQPANRDAMAKHFNEFLSGKSELAYTKPFYESLEGADKAFIQTVERIVTPKTFGSVQSFKVTGGEKNLVLELKMQKDNRVFDAVFVDAGQTSLVGNINEDNAGSPFAPFVKSRAAKSDLVFYGGHSSGGLAEGLLQKQLGKSVPGHALVIVAGCETASFANFLLAFNDRPLANKPVVIANLGFPNYEYFAGQITYILGRNYAYPEMSSNWSEMLSMFPMGTLMHESKTP